MRKGEPVTEPPHGTHARYVSRFYKCRCEKCRAANAAYMKEYRANGPRDRGPNGMAGSGWRRTQASARDTE